MKTPTQSLRRQLKQARQQLSAAEQRQHSQQATHLLLRSPWLQRSKQIAVFLSQAGELDTQHLIQALWRRGHQVYLPVLKTFRGFRQRPMAFAPYPPNTPLVKAHFGIPEPKIAQQHHKHGLQMEVVIVPLVGFDKLGNRLGMGGGYYDRSFARKRTLNLQRPILIGWAHECQSVPQLPAQPWDVPLDAVVTEKQIYRF